MRALPSHPTRPRGSPAHTLRRAPRVAATRAEPSERARGGGGGGGRRLGERPSTRHRTRRRGGAPGQGPQRCVAATLPGYDGGAAPSAIRARPKRWRAAKPSEPARGSVRAASCTRRINRGARDEQASARRRGAGPRGLPRPRRGRAGALPAAPCRLRTAVVRPLAFGRARGPLRALVTSTSGPCLCSPAGRS